MTGSCIGSLLACMSRPGSGDDIARVRDGLEEDGKRGPSRAAARRADAGQGAGQGARRAGGVVLRAQVGRLPGAGVPRRRRGGAAVPQRQGPRPVLPRAARLAARRARATLRARRRGRRAAGDRRPHPAGLGVAEPAHPPRGEPGQDARRTDTRALHRVRRARHRGPLAAGRAVPGAPRSAGRRRQREDSGATSPAPPRTPSWARTG